MPRPSTFLEDMSARLATRKQELQRIEVRRGELRAEIEGLEGRRDFERRLRDGHQQG